MTSCSRKFIANYDLQYKKRWVGLIKCQISDSWKELALYDSVVGIRMSSLDKNTESLGSMTTNPHTSEKGNGIELETLKSVEPLVGKSYTDDNGSGTLPLKALLIAMVSTSFVILVWILFFVFVAFFYIDIPDPDAPAPVVTGNVSGNASDSASGSASMGCMPVEYTGDAGCMSELLQIQSCLPDASTDELSISSDVNQAASAMAIGTAQFGFGALGATTECVEAALPLLCLFHYSLCDTNTGISYLPSSSQCIEVRDGACSAVWAMANAAAPGVLPVCDQLPNTTIVCTGSGDVIDSNTTVLLTCNTDGGFYLDTSGALPACLSECGEFSTYSDTERTTLSVFLLLTAIVGIISGVVAVVVFVYLMFAPDYKEEGLLDQVLQFPTSFVLSGAIIVSIYDLLTIISHIDQKELFCDSRSLSASVENPSDFCITQGVIYYYMRVQMTAWWLLVAFYYFVGTMISFPIFKNNIITTFYLEYKTYFYITLFSLGLLLPIIPAAILADEDPFGGFRASGLIRHPPLVCIGDYPATYYSVIFPIVIMLAIGLSLMIYMGGALLGGIFGRGAERFKESLKEQKIHYRVIFFFLILYFVIIGGFNGYWVFNYRTRDQLIADLTILAVCEGPPNGMGCDRSDIEENPWLIGLGVCILQLAPLFSLLSMLNYRKICRCFMRDTSTSV